MTIRGRHFFKDCYIEGTVDFIFGSGKSIYLTTELNVLPGGAVITAQARNNDHGDTGFAFLHCKVTGEATGAYLGRPWMEKPRVVFAYSEMGKVVHSEGWSLFNKLDRSYTVQFGEYKCMGPGANPNGRAKFLKQQSDAEAQPYLSLGFIEALSWLLPAPTI
ncbi:hypothetical protein Tsubulata_036215 [Turnera subulata]|uniref:Pectinesterase n=1 Tax=Turnera subulata TaxID=218843 RepID=A0A9Q0GCC4_9ROSI|nr:hypothetical protein Tsubulata_036215 [Turnera subulata]